MICKHCHRVYDVDDFTDDTEACDDICPDCLYSGNMFDPEEDDNDSLDPDEDLYDDEELDESYDDIEVSDEEFDEEDITEEL